MDIDKKIRAKGYIRVSTLEQANSDRASLDMQRESITNFAKSQGYDSPLKDDFYIDTSSGATTENRPELQRLLSDAQNGRVRVVLAWKIDRLGRSVLDNETIFKEFDKYNVTFQSVTEPIDTSSHQGKAFRQFLSIFAEMERESITQRMISGRYTKTARDGTNFGSEAPFGYQIENRRYVIVEEQAKIIRLVFDLYNRHRSIKRVLRELERQGIKNIGIKLRDLQINRILKNIKYTGRMRVKDKIYEKKHSEIVSDEIFNTTQDILRDNYQHHKAGFLIAPRYFLRDVARCGHCKHQIVRVECPSQKKGATENLKYYICAVRRKTSKWGCEHRKAHKKEQLESMALSLIFKHIDNLLSDEDYLKKHLHITSQEEILRLRDQIKTKDNALIGKKRAKERFLSLLELRDDTNALERLDRINQEITGINASLKELKIRLEKEQSKKDEFKTQKIFYKQFQDNWDVADEQEKRDLINALIKVIWVYQNGEIKIEYNF
jgi:site-specific DNA recombinase